MRSKKNSHGHLLIAFDLLSFKMFRSTDVECGGQRTGGKAAGRDGFRSPVVTVLLGYHSWVKHVDNRIRYVSFRINHLLWIATGKGLGHMNKKNMNLTKTRLYIPLSSEFYITRCMFSET